jgi:hypothetical protein
MAAQASLIDVAGFFTLTLSVLVKIHPAPSLDPLGPGEPDGLNRLVGWPS